jgi:alkylmercury lyase
MSTLEATIELLKQRRGEPHPQEARLQIALTRLLAKGKPISAQQLATATDQPAEFITPVLEQMWQKGCEFNTQGELIGAALTLTATHHQFIVDGNTLYAWCALDTLFLPAYIGKTAQIKSTCPRTDTPIVLTVSPEGVEAVEPAEAVVTIMTAENCTAGIEGSFCGQIHFFASNAAAQAWVNVRPHFVILTVAEAYELARQVYIEPMLKHVE